MFWTKSKHRKFHFKKPMHKMLFYVAIFFLLVFGWYGIKKIMFWWFVSHYEPPPVTISATKAEDTTWRSYLTAVGTLLAIKGVDLSSDMPGIVEEIRFNSGQFVNQGDIIILMRTSAERATLKSNQAKLALAKINYDREKALNTKKVTSQAALDTRYAEFLEAQAGVEAVEAQIEEKTIVAPFSGRLGIRQVNIGQYISPGTPMVTLQALNPLYVNFNLPEQYLEKIYYGQEVDVTVNYGSGKTVQGKITAINAKVDQTTRNVLIQATIPNDQLALYPGMYGLVKIWLKVQQKIIVVPQTAISYSLSGNYVFVIKEENSTCKQKELRAYRQYIKVGEHREDQVSILEGLKPGDLLITSGQLKLQNGTRVLIDNSVKL